MFDEQKKNVTSLKKIVILIKCQNLIKKTTRYTYIIIIIALSPDLQANLRAGDNNDIVVMYINW